jgi:outer membrane PBP1 activator LpoA protein
MLKKVALIQEIQYLNLYMIKLIDSRKIIITMLVCLLGGCTGSSHQPLAGNYGPTLSDSLQQAEKLSRMADGAEGKDKIHYQLQAIEQFITADRIEHAEQLLSEEVKGKLDPDNAAYKQILLAQISLAKREIATAQQQLSVIWTPSKLPEPLQVKFFSTRSEAYRRSGNIIEAVQERIYLAKHLKAAEDLKANNNAIWEMLSQLTPNILNSLHNTHAKDELNAWIAFASITKQYDTSPAQMLNALNSWKQNYPNHPAISFIPEQGFTASKTTSNNYRQENNLALAKPKKLALVLPLHGAHAQSAQAVRDGFLAAYYSYKEGADKPKIQVYDSTAQDSLEGVYEQAVHEGADFIVGPLVKEEVESLNSGSKASVPMLALNITPKRRAPDNVFQFGLSPEMEAQAVAEKAWSDGHRTALIITPKSAWGNRMQTAFQESWEAMGGTILGVEQISSQTNLNQGIQHLLAIDSSEARAKQLKDLGIKFSYEPRRRQDPDMIFIATNAALARQVKPLLNFYYAARLPAYASSSIFSGRPQPTLDQDLNGIQFCDMPWILDEAIKARSTYKAVSELWPKEFEQYTRLYALGLDAFKIALQIDQLTMLPDLGISGMTGMLTMDAQHKIQRRLMWASFKKGLPYIEGGQG